MKEENILTKMDEDQVKKLVDVGFTREQALAIIEVARTKALFGGFL